MCYISVYHFTHCDTRRPAIINPSTGEAILHPHELPQPCEHQNTRPHHYENLNGSAPCPAHGSCCYPGRILICEGKDSKTKCSGWQALHRILDPATLPKWRKDLDRITARNWNTINLNTDGFAYEEDIRRQFFDAGARMWEFSRRGRMIIDTFHQSQWFPSGGDLEKNDFLEHGELYWNWMVARKELLQLTEAWEGLARVGCMEVCPANLFAVHPHNHVFRKYPERQPTEFPQFLGIPFAFLENYQRQDEILRWHPYYARRDNPPTPTAVDRLWRSPAAPQGYNPELIQRIEAANQPWPGDWQGIIAAQRDSLPLRHYAEASHYYSMQAACGSASPQSEAPPSSGPGTPSWVIPYGQEPYIPWQEIHWDRPATFIESPPVSPKTIPPHKETLSVDTISSVSYEFVEENLFLLNQFVGYEEPAEREFLRISVSGDGLDDETRKSKRRWSEYDLGDWEEEVKLAKRCRTL